MRCNTCTGNPNDTDYRNPCNFCDGFSDYMPSKDTQERLDYEESMSNDQQERRFD